MKTAPLGDLCEIIVGRTPPRANPSFWGKGHPWTSIADMNQGLLLTSTKEELSDVGAKLGRIIAPGTVLLSFKLSIGKVSIAGMPLYTNEAIAALPVKDRELLDERYLLRALESMDLTSGSNRAAMGSTLNKAKLQSISIPVPPIDVQRRIAAILDHADALRAKRRQVLAHLEALTQSIFIGMFGDPSDSTETVPFSEIAELSGGRNIVAGDSAADSAYRVLKISAVTTGRYKPEESKPLPTGYVPPDSHLVRPGDLLMSRANTTELVGAVALAHETPPNLALPDKVWRFKWRESESEPVYYHALFGTKSVRARISQLSSGTGGSMKNISKAKLDSLLLPKVPPARQLEFAAIANSVDNQKRMHRQHSVGLDELFASLQSRAFRGEL